MTIYAETERLLLRAFTMDDVDHIFELDSDPLVHKYLGNNPLTTKQQAEEYVAYILEQYKDHGIGRWVAIEKATGDFIGWSGIKMNAGEKEALNGHTNFHDIGYRFMPKYWGKGYASESSFETLKYGFTILNIDTMYGAAEVDNIASNKVLQKIGLKFVNHFIYHGGAKIAWYELKKEDYAKTMS